MPGFTKLFSSIVTSSIWVEDNATLRVWIAMMAQADADGNVEGTIPGFANLARVSIPEMERAVGILSATDRHSRTPDFEGRRIERFDGGWKLLNYKAYRERGQAKEGSRAPYMRAYRKRESVTSITRNNRNSEIVTRDTEAEERSRREKKEADSLKQVSTQTEDHSSKDKKSEKEQVPLRRHARNDSDLIWFTESDELNWTPETIAELTKRFPALTEKNGGWDSTLRALSNWHAEAPLSKRKQLTAHRWLFQRLFPKREREAVHASQHKPPRRKTDDDLMRERWEKRAKDFDAAEAQKGD